MSHEIDFQETEEHRVWTVLSLIAESDRPLGSTAIAENLNNNGWSIAEATVGRLLRRLENRGYLQKVGRQGRILTEVGHRHLQKLELERRQDEHGRQLRMLLSETGYRQMQGLVHVRMLVESEAAALAAENATTEQLDKMAAIVQETRERIARDLYTPQEDNEFHNVVAEASGNDVLAAVVRYLRESKGMANVFMQVRYGVGPKSVADHARIYEEIRQRRPAGARQVMREHLQHVMEGVDEYVRQNRASD